MYYIIFTYKKIMLKKILKTLNIYGVDFQLLYKKEDIFHTIIGLILSIISFMIVVSVSLIYTLELFDKTSFTLTTNTLQIGGEASIDFSNVPILLSFSDLNGTTKYLDPTLVNLKIIRQENTPFIDNNEHIIKTTFTEIELEECKDNEINEKIIKEGYNIKNFMCVKQGQNLKISGRFGDSAIGFSFLQIFLNKCQNGSEIICKSEEEIIKYAENTFLNLIYLSYSVDHFNVSNPIIEIYRSDGFSLSFDYLRRYFYYFSPSIYETDRGLFISKKKYHNFFEFEIIYPDIIDKKVNVDYTKNNPSLIEVFITFYCREKHYVRKYVTIQDVLGNIGGFLDIILKIFQYVSVYLSKKAFICDIMNSVVNNQFVKNGNFRKKKILKKFTHNDSINLDKSNKNILNSINPNKHMIYVNNYTGIDKKVLTLSFFNETKKAQKSKFDLYEYIFPFFVLKCSKRYNLLFVFYNNIKKLLSIEVLIPIIDYNIKSKLAETEIG